MDESKQGELEKFKKGLTTIVLILGGFLLVLMFVVLNNAWFSPTEAKSALMANKPGITKIKDYKRNFVSFSEFLVVEDGSMGIVCLDSNIFRNYRFVACPQKPAPSDWYN